MAATGIIAQEVAGDVRMTDTRADEAERSRRRRQLHEDEIECSDLCFLVFFFLGAGDRTSTAGASAGGEETGAGGEAVGVVVGAGTGGEFVGAGKGGELTGTGAGGEITGVKATGDEEGVATAGVGAAGTTEALESLPAEMTLP